MPTPLAKAALPLPSLPRPGFGSSRSAIFLDPARLERERLEVQGLVEQALSPTAPRMRVTEGNRLTPLYPDPKVGHGLIMKALGITDGDFYQGILDQIADLCCAGPMRSEYAERVNFVLSVIKGIKPTNQLEVMLALRTAAAHMLSMASAKDRFFFCDSHPSQQNASRDYRNYTKTTSDLMEALKRLRSTGEQTITVQYINVQDNAQAIVGDVTQNAIEKERGPAKLTAGNEAQLTASIDENSEAPRITIVRRKASRK